MYSDARGVARSATRALDLWTEACDGADPMACVELGRLYASGRGVRADRDHALALYKKACEVGMTMGCDAANRLK
jgi:TPR repeat protein